MKHGGLDETSARLGETRGCNTGLRKADDPSWWPDFLGANPNPRGTRGKFPLAFWGLELVERFERSLEQARREETPQSDAEALAVHSDGVAYARGMGPDDLR